MTSKPKILITNDDGISAPGLRRLWEAAHKFGDVTICAPHRQRSGAGTSLTFYDTIFYKPVGWDFDTPAWEIEGTPADCVRVGISAILKEKPDLILSGINHGSNAGRNIFYSGTVGGTIEGALKGIPGIAFSYVEDDIEDFDHVTEFIPEILQYYLEHPITPGMFLNVNFPHHPDRIFKGYRLARQGQGMWAEKPEIQEHPDGRHAFQMGGGILKVDEHEDSDIALLNQGYITIVPIHIHDLTHHGHIDEHRTRIEDRLNKFFRLK